MIPSPVTRWGGIFEVLVEHARSDATTVSIGAWFQKHYNRRRLDVGVFAAARQLRKQGVPLEIALLLLNR